MAGSTITTLSAGASSVNWRAPFLTASLNTHMAVNTPPGVYRGLNVRADSGTALGVILYADSAHTDHYLFYQSGSYGLGVWITGSNISLDLTPYAGMTIALAVYVTYVPGATTTAQIRAYQLSPSDELAAAAERSELVILGTVVVPASGIIPSSNVTAARRTSAWASVAAEAAPWASLLRNGGFEWRDATASRWSINSWEDDGGASWGAGTAHTGSRGLGLIGTGAPQTGLLSQYLFVPVFQDAYPLGPRFLVSFWVKVAQVSTAGSLAFVLEFADLNNTNPATVTVPIATGSTDSDWRKVETIVSAPSSARFLRRAGFKATGINFGASSLGVSLDDVQLFADRDGALAPSWEQERQMGPLRVSPLVFGDPAASFSASTTADVALYLDSSLYGGDAALVGGYRAAAGQSYAPVFKWTGRTEFGAGLLGNINTAAKPRISMGASATGGVLTLIQEVQVVGGVAVRWYSDPSGSLIETWNCLWHLGGDPGGPWSKDVAGQLAWKKVYSAGAAVTLATKAANVDTGWDDSGWTYLKTVGETSSTVDSVVGLPLEVSGYSRDHASVVLRPMTPFMVLDGAGVMRTVSTVTNKTLTVADVLPAVGSFDDVAGSWLFVYVKIVAGAPVFFLSNTFPTMGTYYPRMSSGDTTARYLATMFMDDNSPRRLRAVTFDRGVYVWDEMALGGGTEMLTSGNATSWTPAFAGNHVPPHSYDRGMIRVDLVATNASGSAANVQLRPGSNPAIVGFSYYVGIPANGQVSKTLDLNLGNDGYADYICSSSQVSLALTVKSWRDYYHR